jgi:hypothetical protein
MGRPVLVVSAVASALVPMVLVQFLALALGPMGLVQFLVSVLALALVPMGLVQFLALALGLYLAYRDLRPVVGPVSGGNRQDPRAIPTHWIWRPAIDGPCAPVVHIHLQVALARL